MARFPLLALAFVFALTACDTNSSFEPPADATVSWPGENWQTSTPEQEGLDAQTIV